MVKWMLVLVLTLASLTARAEVSASVDKNPVLVGEALTLTIRTGGGGEDPDLSVLEQDFQILGRSSSSQFQIINGRTERSREWLVQLRPLRQGELRIPAIPAGNEATQPITLQVQQPQRDPGELPEAFIEFSADKSTAHVREQLLLTSRLFVRGDLVSGNLSDPSSDAAVLEQVGEQTETQALRGNHRYRVIQRRYALFPERSGSLQINAPVFSGEISTGQQRRSLFGFNRATRALHAAGEPLRFEVRPQPETADSWLPARHVELSDGFSPTQGPYPAGDPLTRTITLRVDGQLHTQLPDLQIPVPDGVQSYTEAPQDRTVSTDAGLTAIRQYSVALIPHRGGELALPPMTLQWWDTESDVMRQAELPARTLQIEPAAAVPTPPPSTPSSAAIPAATDRPAPVASPAAAPLWPWQVATLAMAAGWLGTLISWWWWQRPRRRPSRPVADSPGRRECLRQLKAGSAVAARQALLDWAREQIGPLPGLLSLAGHCDDAGFATALQQLDAAAFGPGGDFDREPLIRFVRNYRPSRPGRDDTALPPLYPEPR